MCASCSAPGVLSMPRAFAVSEWTHSCKVKYLIILYVVPTGFPIGRLHISFFGTSTGRKTSVPPFSCGERGGTKNFLYIKCHSMAANFRTWASRSMKDVSRVACCML